MNTPLYSTLKQLADSQPLRLHIPGHKGKAIPYLSDLLPLDFTEITPTGNLYQVGEPFQTAQALWAERFSFPHCQFLTGGSTQGVYTAMALSGTGAVLLDRYAHRSAVVACGLLQRDPIYLPRPWKTGEEVALGVCPQEVEQALQQNPNIQTVFVTSPTMYGVLSDLEGIAQVAHKFGAKLVVDGAHGAHLPWLGIDHYGSADLVCLSAHKTLPALGQASLLLFRDLPPSLVGETASLFGTSSPSYLIALSMDLARDWMDKTGQQEYQRVATQVARLRDRFPSLRPPLSLDPTRLCLLARDGKNIATALEKEGIYLEMANSGHLLGVFTAMDSQQDIDRFEKAVTPRLSQEETLPDLSPCAQFPLQKMPIQDVISAEKITVSMADSRGNIVAENIAPYPPGVPVVVMGEVMGQEQLDYLEKIGYHQEEVWIVKTPSGGTA